MKLIIIISSLLSVPPISTLFLKHPQLMFFPYWQTASFTLAKNSTEMSGSVRIFMFSANMPYCGYREWEYCEYLYMCLVWGWNRVKVYKQYYLGREQVENHMIFVYTIEGASVHCWFPAQSQKERGSSSCTVFFYACYCNILWYLNMCWRQNPGNEYYGRNSGVARWLHW
jgi:uncharacterized membrane protein